MTGPKDHATLSRDLRHGGFRPLPKIDTDGMLTGVQMWRLRNGLAELVILHPTGGALAVRAFAQFDYEQPYQHGPVIETRTGYALNALHWLLDTSKNWTENQEPPR